MCNYCKADYPTIEVTLTDAKHSSILCPNCMCSLLLDGHLEFIPDYNLICEVTGEKGAVKYESMHENYILRPDIMLRLINHSLRPAECELLLPTFVGSGFLLHRLRLLSAKPFSHGLHRRFGVICTRFG